MMERRVRAHWPRVLCFNASAAPLSTPGLQPDMQFMDDARWDSAGPGNTGFVFVRSNCRTKRLMRAVSSSLWLLLRTHSDQRFLMRLMRSRLVRDVSMALLPARASCSRSS